jgi:hypothetical protein
MMALSSEILTQAIYRRETLRLATTTLKRIPWVTQTVEKHFVTSHERRLAAEVAKASSKIPKETCTSRGCNDLAFEIGLSPDSLINSSASAVTD